MMRFSQIKTSAEFPLKPGELLRVKLPGGSGRREFRIKVGPQINEKPPVFGAVSQYHDVSTNKEQITLIGNERKLRRV